MSRRLLKFLGYDLTLARSGAQNGHAPEPAPPVRQRRAADDVEVIKPPAHRPLESSADDPPERQALVAEVNAISWYHTLDLPNGVITPGGYDHRPALHHYHLPDDLTGQEVLDVAILDGFWSFQLEQRGASKVIGIDIANRSDWDIPPDQRERFLDSGSERAMSAGFHIAQRALGSAVERRVLSVYDLSPETIGQQFDFVHCGDLLIHLRDPVKAAQNIRSVTRKHALFAESIDPDLLEPGREQQVTFLGAYNHHLVWWLPSPTVWKNMLLGAGFAQVEQLSLFRLDYPSGRRGPYRAVYRATV